MYQIEKGIPMPQKQVKYPFDEMETGDSFFVKDGNVNSILTRVWQVQQKFSAKKFSVRNVDGGVRVWRVK